MLHKKKRFDMQFYLECNLYAERYGWAKATSMHMRVRTTISSRKRVASAWALEGGVRMWGA